jgi:hypothetical protein
MVLKSWQLKSQLSNGKENYDVINSLTLFIISDWLTIDALSLQRPEILLILQKNFEVS